jgi:hypothetical protein
MRPPPVTEQPKEETRGHHDTVAMPIAEANAFSTCKNVFGLYLSNTTSLVTQMVQHNVAAAVNKTRLCLLPPIYTTD